MKKLISMVAALAIIGSCGVVSLAAEGVESPSAGTDVVKAEAEDPGIIVHVEEVTLTDAQKSSLQEAAGDNSTEAYDVWLEDGSTGDDITNDADVYPLEVAFMLDAASNVTGILVWNDADAKWDSADFTIVDGAVIVTFEHLCPVAFELKKAEAPAKEAESSSGKSSAQTGYNGLIYIVSAVALAGGAIVCFSTAGKKANKEVM